MCGHEREQHTRRQLRIPIPLQACRSEQAINAEISGTCVVGEISRSALFARLHDVAQIRFFIERVTFRSVDALK